MKELKERRGGERGREIFKDTGLAEKLKRFL